MRSAARYWILGLLVFAIVFGWMAARHWHEIQSYGYLGLGDKPHPMEAELSPKLAPGTVVRQSLEWPRIVHPTVAQHYADRPVCLSVYMATHGGSARGGQLQMTLEKNTETRSASQIPFDQLRDLRFESFCFDDLPLGEVYGQPVDMVLEATQGVATAAPSVYFDRAPEGAERVQINELTHPSHALVYRLQIKRDAVQSQLSAWFILTALALLSALVLSARTDD